MPLSWNEIRQNAITFARNWTEARRETAEKQTFWNEFFTVFGIQRRAVATFEERVKGLSGNYEYIDMFWTKTLLVEHKSRGGDLGKAQSQAFRYIEELISSGRQEEVPRYVVVSDFARIALHDLEPDDQKSLPLLGRVRTIEFALEDFHKNIHEFAFIPGYKQHKFEEQDPINIQAVAILGDLHDTLAAGGYSGHDLERFLVRVLFCLFAEDTGIFEREDFRLYIENQTKPDGSDLGPQLAKLFDVLNTEESKRQANLDETLKAFRWVNGDLFAERLGFVDFNRDMRNALLACTRFDWARISPAVFGSLFQSVMEPRERRQLGEHYTSERDILKVVRSLFLDDLWEEFRRIGKNKPELRRFHEKISKLRFLDPACGCGNFLVVTYRELRLLEIELLQTLHDGKPLNLSLLDVDAFYGIEISEWPARIAEVALWFMDHQMNQRLSEACGVYYARLPLRKSPTIVCGNALRLDWKKILPPEKCGYLLGNPPYVGKQHMLPEQNKDMAMICGHIKGHGVLDYVAAWYVKAASYIKGTPIRAAFLSTNSVVQGEQVGILWQALLAEGIKIHFAHRPFAWFSEARGKANVHVVIVGFGCNGYAPKRIFDYDESAVSPEKKGKDKKRDPVVTVSEVANISPYLVEGPDVVITGRSKPLCAVPEITFGSMPNDGGHLILNNVEREVLLQEHPEAEKYLRRFVGSDEFLNGIERWCLWLDGENPAEFMRIRPVKERILAVADYRGRSARGTTKELARTPAYFGEIRQPDSKYLFIPAVSSENRLYIPMGFMRSDVIASNAALLVPGAKIYHFGVLSSAMHMAWVRRVAGRLESRFRYSNRIVYNNFPWPDDPTPAKRARLEEAAQHILDLRVELGDGRGGFLPKSANTSKGTSLAVLYGPGMPLPLRNAHRALDVAVDRCYRPQPFETERQRVEFLFGLYQKLTAPLMPAMKKSRSRRS